MEFPRYVFRHAGSNRTRLGSYAELLVSNEAEHADALADGWGDDLQAAIEGPSLKAPPVEETPGDDSPPTKAELQQKATELGVEWRPQWGERKLAEAINEALKAKV